MDPNEPFVPPSFYQSLYDTPLDELKEQVAERKKTPAIFHLSGLIVFHSFSHHTKQIPGNTSLFIVLTY
jgi:hypothetical protein